MKRVLNFSGGLCSFWAAKRVVEEHGNKDLTLLFADTLIEDDDLYRFNVQASEHLDVPITRVCVGLTPWQLFRKRGIIANARRPVCSHILKREPLDEWIHANCDPNDTVRYVGMDWEEGDRLERMRKAKVGWTIEAPMNNPPIMTKEMMIEETRKLGIIIPRLYGLGFPHNNCGGACVAAGISHFVHLYHVLPEKFMEWEKEEQDTIEELTRRGITAMTMLKDRRGGVTNNLSLRQLRARIEAGEKLSKFDWGACGCGTEYKQVELIFA